MYEEQLLITVGFLLDPLRRWGVFYPPYNPFLGVVQSYWRAGVLACSIQ